LQFFSLTAEQNAALLVPIPKFIAARQIICVAFVGKFQIVLSLAEINAVLLVRNSKIFFLAAGPNVQCLFAIPKI
jgi:hypothetical protein